jgi:hypothetical protein
LFNDQDGFVQQASRTEKQRPEVGAVAEQIQAPTKRQLLPSFYIWLAPII